MMDLSLLDKSSVVTPLLVRLYDSHRLASLATDDQPSARSELMGAVCELLGMQLNPREQELVADVLITLVRQAETDLRVALSERLSELKEVPLRLVLQLSNDEICVAAPMLRNSMVLGDMDLLYIIKSKTAEYWREIARRRALSDHVVNVLAQTRDVDTAVNLAENEALVLDDAALVMLSDLAQGNERLALPLLRRSEVSDDLAASLYEHVGEAMQSYVSSHFGEAGDVAKALREARKEFTAAALRHIPESEEPKVEEEVIIGSKATMSPALMIKALRRGEFGYFINRFAKYTNLTESTIEEILMQESGQGLAVACHSCHIGKADFISIYLLSHRFRKPSETTDAMAISKAVEYFNRITPAMAREILADSGKGSKEIH